MKNNISLTLPTYPVLMFATKYKAILPLIAALLALTLGAWANYRTSMFDFSVIGLVAALIVYLLVKGTLELVELVVELLIPQ
jgi:hypothetical protein